MDDQYFTIAAPSEGFYKDRGSKFHAYAFPCYQEADWQEALEAIKKDHFKARHHCFAYRIGLDGQQFRANDDGEPSGTAGRPILGQIDSFNLTNVFIVVVRYFGGTKLGASGLIQAYKAGAADALQQATVIEKFVEEVYQISFDYSLMSAVMNTTKKLDLNVLSQTFEERGDLHIAIKKSEVADTLLRFRAGLLGVSEEEAQDIEQIAGAKILFQYTR